MYGPRMLVVAVADFPNGELGTVLSLECGHDLQRPGWTVPHPGGWSDCEFCYPPPPLPPSEEPDVAEAVEAEYRELEPPVVAAPVALLEAPAPTLEAPPATLVAPSEWADDAPAEANEWD